MDYAVVRSRASRGLDAPPVRVEVHVAAGLPAFTIVGMPETAVRESRDRVRSAIVKSHLSFPDGRITVNLAPADLPKGGGRFDLPIALGILCASGQLPSTCLEGTECLGELALDGSLRDVRGAVSSTMAATAAGQRVALASSAATRCLAVPGAELLYANDLLSLCARLQGHGENVDLAAPAAPAPPSVPDLSAVRGLSGARRALELAAAGGHNLLLYGPPGTGKSLLAQCLPGILPPPDRDDLLIMLALQDLQSSAPAPAGRPFRSPHHSASAAALVGGGTLPRPGEISLAHGGVLFLDELPEFSRHTLDMLRQPLETGEIHLSRARHEVCYPARFQLVAAMNPCPCGYAGDPERSCRCTPGQRRAYAGRLSGPLLDRIDIQVRVSREPVETLLCRAEAETSVTVGARVQRALERQLRRQGKPNASLAGEALTDATALTEAARDLLSEAGKRLGMSTRSLLKALRVARTIADLAEQERVERGPLAEALSYRQLVDDGTP